MDIEVSIVVHFFHKFVWNALKMMKMELLEGVKYFNNLSFSIIFFN